MLQSALVLTESWSFDYIYAIPRTLPIRKTTRHYFIAREKKCKSEKKCLKLIKTIIMMWKLCSRADYKQKN